MAASSVAKHHMGCIETFASLWFKYKFLNPKQRFTSILKKSKRVIFADYPEGKITEKSKTQACHKKQNVVISPEVEPKMSGHERLDLECHLKDLASSMIMKKMYLSKTNLNVTYLAMLNVAAMIWLQIYLVFMFEDDGIINAFQSISLKG